MGPSTKTANDDRLIFVFFMHLCFYRGYLHVIAKLPGRA